MNPVPQADDAVLPAAKDFLHSFHSPGRLLVAISGGSDSTGLLLALAAAVTSPEFSGFSLSACTVDHGLRSESALEADRVAQLCARLGIHHSTRRWDGDKPTTGLQAAARLARYRLLALAARDVEAICVVTGHTQDDQQETLVMRAARSADHDAPGMAGMAETMLFERNCWVVRPFLRVRRQAIRSFAAAQNESWMDDPSNLNRSFERVRVRQALEKTDAAIDNDSGGARLLLSQRAADLLARYATVHAGLVARIDPLLVERIGDPDCDRAILMLAAVLGGRVHPVGQETAGRLRAFLTSRRDGRMTAARVVFDRRRDGLYLYREARSLPSVVLAAGGVADWDGRFSVRNLGKGPVELSADGDTRRVAAALVQGGLVEAVARRAAKAALRIDPPAGSSAEVAVDVAVEQRLAPYDTFLPGFDLTMANEIASLFGRAPFPSSPVHIV